MKASWFLEEVSTPFLLDGLEFFSFFQYILCTGVRVAGLFFLSLLVYPRKWLFMLHVSNVQVFYFPAVRSGV